MHVSLHKYFENIKKTRKKSIHNIPEHTWGPRPGGAGVSASGTWSFRTFDYSYPGLFVPSMDCSYRGLFVPSWTVRTMTFRTLDCSYRGLFVPSWTVRTMDYSYRPWTFRTLDCSYRGLFVPSWTVRTMDYSYHHWTIRTVMQDSQKLTFPTKMCLCSVWVRPPEFFWHFSQRLGTF